MANILDVAEKYMGGKMVYRSASAYEALGRELDREGIGYYEYLAFLLNRYAEKAKFRNIIASRKILEDFKNIYRPGLNRKAEISAFLDAESFETEVNDGRVPRDILEDDSLLISPLFRFITAKQLGYSEVAKKYKQEAVLQLKETPVFFDVFESKKDFLPLTKEKINE